MSRYDRDRCVRDQLSVGNQGRIAVSRLPAAQWKEDPLRQCAAGDARVRLGKEAPGYDLLGDQGTPLAQDLRVAWPFNGESCASTCPRIAGRRDVPVRVARISGGVDRA